MGKKIQLLKLKKKKKKKEKRREREVDYRGEREREREWFNLWRGFSWPSFCCCASTPWGLSSWFQSLGRTAALAIPPAFVSSNQPSLQSSTSSPSALGWTWFWTSSLLADHYLALAHHVQSLLAHQTLMGLIPLSCVEGLLLLRKPVFLWDILWTLAP